MDNQLVKINDDTLFDICEQFNPIFNQRKCNLEFGLLEFESDLYPYLIDYTIDNSDETLQEKDIENGVVSNGRIKGKIVKIENISIEQSLNAHCQNEISLENILEEPIIFVAELPDIKLMEKLNENNIGLPNSEHINLNSNVKEVINKIEDSDKYSEGDILTIKVILRCVQREAIVNPVIYKKLAGR